MQATYGTWLTKSCVRLNNRVGGEQEPIPELYLAFQSGQQVLTDLFAASLVKDPSG